MPEHISISPGTRQKHVGQVRKHCEAIRTTLLSIERDCEGFLDDESAINAQLTKHLSDYCSAIGYLVGQANGALFMPDLVDGKAVR